MTPLSTPSGYWEAMEVAGLKKRKALVATPKKSPEETLDEALASSMEHCHKMDKTKTYL
jgi:hypothetical protein